MIRSSRGLGTYKHKSFDLCQHLQRTNMVVLATAKRGEQKQQQQKKQPVDLKVVTR
jgi:hypothetical protein